MTDAPTRPVRKVADDTCLPFQVETLDVRGRVVRFGSLLTTSLARHNYPRPVTLLLAEAMTLTALLATTLRQSGRFITQTSSDGPVSMLVVDFEAPDRLRACARFDKERLAKYIKAGKTSQQELMGKGHFAMTMDQGGQDRYQGLVPMDGSSFEDTAHQYFESSEQIPTIVRLAVAETMIHGENGFTSSWRSGGFLLQFLPHSPERRRMADLPPGDAPPDFVMPEQVEDDAWVSANFLSETIKDEELLDPTLSPEQLLFRLFHEQGVMVFDPQPLHEFCRCSEDNIKNMLKQFSEEDRAHMVENNKIHVVCEFCSRDYNYAPEDVS